MTVHELRELLADKDDELEIKLGTGRAGTLAGYSEWDLYGIEERDTDLVLRGEV